MILYLAQAAAIIAAGWLFYTVLLRRETFFSVNRWFLLVLIVTAFVAPRFSVPRHLSIRAQFEGAPMPASLPVVSADTIRANSAAVSALVNVPVNDTPPAPAKTMGYWIMWIYWSGVVVLGLNFLVQLGYILYKRWKLPAIHDGRITILEEKEDHSPGSFWNYIFINPEKYDWETYERILAHEKIHVQKKHSADLLMAELVVMFQWFNPFAWLLRRSIEANLEFQADHTLLDQNKVDLTGYQLSLVQVAAPNQLLNIQSAYNQSLLQQRIRMMVHQRSNLHQSWKYLAAAPVFLLILAAVNTPAAPAPVLGSFLPVKKDTRDTRGVLHMKSVPLSSSPVIVAKSVPRNNSAKPETKPGQDQRAEANIEPIDLPHTSSVSSPVVPEKLDESVRPTALEPVKNLPASKNTSPNAANSAGVYASYSIAEIEKLNKVGITTATLIGFYGIGWKAIPVNDLVAFHRMNITPSFIQGYQQIGFTHLSAGEVIHLRKLDMPPSRINAFYQIGVRLPVDSLYYMERNEVYPPYIQSFQQLGYTSMSCVKLAIMKKKGLTASYVSSFQQIGFKSITIDQAMELMDRKVRASYLSQLLSNGVSIPSIGYYLSELKK